MSTSPVQRAVIGSVAQVGRVFQTLELSDDPRAGSSRFNNFIDFRDAFGGVLNLRVQRRVVGGHTRKLKLRMRAFKPTHFQMSSHVCMIPFCFLDLKK
jgi:hypothetical protein